MFYITYNNLRDAGYIGILKKISDQIKVFENLFGRVYYTCYAGGMIYLMYQEEIIEKELAITKEMCNEIIYKWLIKYEARRTYIRYSAADKWFVELLKNLKENNIRSVIEIPTYPYDGEGIIGRSKLEDSYYRMQMRNYIERIATNTDEVSVWGIPCIRLLNGVNLEDNPLRVKKKEKERIVLVGVSSLALWQGYERVIVGLSNYYKKGGEIKFLFKIIGEGPEESNYRMLVKKHHVEQYVEFCGRLDGELLNKQYSLSDLAVSSLGRYKSNIHDITPIKGAEYCARGIPFICGYHDMRFKGDEPFIMNVTNDSEPIDMEEVVEFYKNITAQQDYQEQMREYAVKNLSWDVVMRDIIEYLK